MGGVEEIDGTDLGPGAPYDGRAALYDRLISSRLYNRLAWSTSPADYEEFAATAVAESSGPLLEVAAGTAAATAAIHAASTRPTVLVDLSRDMLERAEARIAEEGSGATDGVRFVRADLLDLPFEPGGFDTVLALGAAHLFADLAPLREALLAQLAPGGRLHIAGLVAETRRGRAYLRLLERAGEVAPARTADELQAEMRPVQFRLEGCMAYAVLERDA